MAGYQSLYRRYRPRRFADVRGQDHVVAALRNAARDDRVGHAYLFSGPRGTGKTSTARILAKVLNCANPVDGEPCLACDSCLSIEAGTSFDLHELDAASNNKIEHVRELIERVAYSTPGRTKVYVLDEVHMLTPASSNALLKTLEEPPAGVVFVLATTEPQKVLDTIRSRTQHLEFHLLPADALEEYVRSVVADAALDVDDEGIAHALRTGAGSARDTLSALEQIAVTGAVIDGSQHVDALVEAIVDRDVVAALTAVAEAMNAGREPKVLGTALVGRLRDVFLASVRARIDHLPDYDRDHALALAARAERPLLTRGLEVLGQALVDMRDAPDQRVTLEVALVRLTDVASDTSPAALVERIERLERAVASHGTTATVPVAAPAAPTRPTPMAAAPVTPTSTSPTGVRAALGAVRARPAPATTTAPAPAASANPPAPDEPSRDQLTLAWGDEVLHGLPNMVRALFSSGRFIDASPNGVEFALPSAVHRDKCETYRPDVEAALGAHFGRRVPLRLVVDDGRPAVQGTTAGASAADPADPADEMIDMSELRDAVEAPASGVDLFTQSFPGAQVVHDS